MGNYTSKVVLADGTVVVDLTADTATAPTILSGYTGHDKSGAPIVGSCTYDADTSGATVAVAEILSGKTGFARGVELTGTMPNVGKQNGAISAKDGKVQISQGYHDGSGTVALDATEASKLVGSNIKSGVKLFGVTGTYSGASVTAQSKSATPSLTAQTILPDSGYDYLSQVSVGAIPITYADNAAGGKTVTIG